MAETPEWAVLVVEVLAIVGVLALGSVSAMLARNAVIRSRRRHDRPQGRSQGR